MGVASPVLLYIVLVHHFLIKVKNKKMLTNDQIQDIYIQLNKPKPTKTTCVMPWENTLLYRGLENIGFFTTGKVLAFRICPKAGGENALK